MSLICRLFGHKWKDGVCNRCNKKKAEYDDKVQAAISGNKEILQTGRTSVDQLEHDLKKAIADEILERTKTVPSPAVSLAIESHDDVIKL